MLKIKKTVKLIGLFFILMALILNPIVVEKAFSADGNLENITLVLVFEGILLLIGVILFVKGVWIAFRWKEILLFLVILLLAFSVLELGYRVLTKKPALYSRHPYLNYYGTPNYKSLDGLNMHNSLGFRGEEIEIPKSGYRIVILGGSSAYTEQVEDWTKDWARQLEKELKEIYKDKKIEVINAALPGWNSWESLINLEFRVLDLNPDLIIIYHGTNDVHTRLVSPENYKSDNVGRRKQWEETSCRFPFCSRVILKLTGRGKNDFSVDAPTFGATLNPEYNEILGMTPLEALKINKPIYFERNLKNMILIAKDNGIKVLLSTWANSNQFDPLTDYAATYHYEVGFKENNEVVKKVGKDKNIEVYDFAFEMPKDKKFWADGRHINEEGAELKGELFANYIYLNKIIEV